MRLLIFIFILTFKTIVAQDFELKSLDSIPLNAERFIGVDDFENYYYQNGNTLYKKTSQKVYSYTNTSLGTITSIDITNPLKIIVFYRGFNTIVLLDNRLNEYTDAINLTTEQFSKNVNFVGISSNNNIWLFSNDDNTLSLLNYEDNTLIFESQPLSFFNDNFEVSYIKSDYKFCYLFSENQQLTFNEFGSFIGSMFLPAKNIYHYDDGYFYFKENSLYYAKSDRIQHLENFTANHKTANMNIKNNKAYFFDTNTVYKYEVLKK